MVTAETLLRPALCSHIATTPWRWFVVATFGLGAMGQALTWNTYAPVSNTTQLAYGDEWPVR